jgi:hypothetical protein
MSHAPAVLAGFLAYLFLTKHGSSAIFKISLMMKFQTHGGFLATSGASASEPGDAGITRP